MTTIYAVDHHKAKSTPQEFTICKDEREKVLKQLHEWFENYCEGNEDPDLWMAYLHAERAFRKDQK